MLTFCFTCSVFFNNTFNEKEMTTHSSTLAWRIPWTEEPGRLQSMGSQRVRHDWAISLHSLHSLHTLSLEKEMAAYSSVLVRRVPWTEEPGWPWSMGCRELDMTEVIKHACIWEWGLYALWLLTLLKGSPTDLPNPTFWKFLFLVLDPQAGTPMWGHIPHFLGKVCNCNSPAFVGCLPRGTGLVSTSLTHLVVIPSLHI